MESYRKRYRLPWQIKMALLYMATICVVLPTNTANVDASNKREISKGHITFRVLNGDAPAKEKEIIPAAEIADMSSAPVKELEKAPVSVKKARIAKKAPAGIADIHEPIKEKTAGPRYVYWKTVKAKVTAYSPDALSCGIYANGKTSIGKNAWKRTGVAADPTLVPYGTMINIPGVGLRTVDDTGSGMRNSWRKQGVHHFDLRMTYPYECRKWGVQWLDVDLYRIAR